MSPAPAITGKARRRPPPSLVALAASGWVALALTALPSVAPLRESVGFAFVLICPGAALVRHWPGQDRLERAVLAVGLSLSSVMLVAEVLVMSHAWSAPAALAGLAAVTSAGALAPGVTRQEGVGAR
jgi:uncharacterized membrane protein